MQVLEVSSLIIAVRGSPFLPKSKLPETRPRVLLIIGLPGAWQRAEPCRGAVITCWIESTWESSWEIYKPLGSRSLRPEGAGPRC